MDIQRLFLVSQMQEMRFLVPRQIVKACGLQGAPQLNGKRGFVVETHGDRFAVVFFRDSALSSRFVFGAHDRRYRIKPANLELAEVAELDEVDFV